MAQEAASYACIHGQMPFMPGSKDCSLCMQALQISIVAYLLIWISDPVCHQHLLSNLVRFVERT